MIARAIGHPGADPVLDRVSRRSAAASIVIHGALALIALAPGITAIVRHDADPETPPPVAAQPQRLVLAPAAVPQPPPLPPLAAAALPGFTDTGAEPFKAEVAVPRNTDRPGVDRSRGDDGSTSAPVNLPKAASDPLTQAARLDGKRWTEKELTGEQKRVADAANLLEILMHAEYRADWYRSRTAITKPTLYLRVQVDARGRLVAGTRLTSTGSTALDESIDRWLRQEQGPIGLPNIAPGVMHVFQVSLW